MCCKREVIVFPKNREQIMTNIMDFSFIAWILFLFLKNLAIISVFSEAKQMWLWKSHDTAMTSGFNAKIIFYTFLKIYIFWPKATNLKLYGLVTSLLSSLTQSHHFVVILILFECCEENAIKKVKKIFYC